MHLQPLQQWVCDKCGEIIEKPEDGWLEWLGETNTLKHGGFKIVHHKSASPHAIKNRDCYHYSNHPEREDMHLKEFLGPDGLAELSAWVYSPGVKDLKEWAEMFRRLHVPYYEEARRRWHAAESDGYFHEIDESARYSQDVLKEVIEQYGDAES